MKDNGNVQKIGETPRTTKPSLEPEPVAQSSPNDTQTTEIARCSKGAGVTELKPIKESAA
jgi:hypothetical protein